MDVETSKTSTTSTTGTVTTGAGMSDTGIVGTSGTMGGSTDALGTTTGSESNGIKGQVKETVSQVKEHAQQALEQTKQKAGELLGQAKDQISEQVVQRKETAAGSLSGIANALRSASSHITDETAGPVGQYARTAAEQVDKLSTYLQEKDLNELAQDTERFARQQPALFLGGAFFLGVLAARFFRASERAIVPTGNNIGSSNTGYGYSGETPSRALTTTPTSNLMPASSTPAPTPDTNPYAAHGYVPGGVAGSGEQPSSPSSYDMGSSSAGASTSGLSTSGASTVGGTSSTGGRSSAGSATSSPVTTPAPTTNAANEI